MPIQTVQLTSSALASATYDDETQDLSVTFHNGGTYDHHDVPIEVFQGLVNAPSPGRYWWDTIKEAYP